MCHNFPVTLQKIIPSPDPRLNGQRSSKQQVESYLANVHEIDCAQGIWSVGFYGIAHMESQGSQGINIFVQHVRG